MLREQKDSDVGDPTADEAVVGQIIVGFNDGVTVLSLIGEHDLSTADELFVAIHLQAEQGRGVVITLSETMFIDSTIIRRLFQGDTQMLRNGRRLVIHNDSDSPVERVLELSGIREQLLCADTLYEAIRLASQCYRE